MDIAALGAIAGALKDGGWGLLALALFAIGWQARQCRKDAEDAKEAVIAAYKLRSDEIKEMAIAATAAINTSTSANITLTASIDRRTAVMDRMNEALTALHGDMERNHPYWQERIGRMEGRNEDIVRILREIQEILRSLRGGA